MPAALYKITLIARQVSTDHLASLCSMATVAHMLCDAWSAATNSTRCSCPSCPLPSSSLPPTADWSTNRISVPLLSSEAFSSSDDPQSHGYKSEPSVRTSCPPVSSANSPWSWQGRLTHQPRDFQTHQCNFRMPSVRGAPLLVMPKH